MTEIEVKIKVGDPVEARRRLLALGAIVERERSLEENTLFDFPSGLLAAKRQALRLRTVGRTTILTFKGAPQKSRSFKVRDEYETEVRSAKQAREILSKIGELSGTTVDALLDQLMETDGERHRWAAP